MLCNYDSSSVQQITATAQHHPHLSSLRVVLALVIRQSLLFPAVTFFSMMTAPLLMALFVLVAVVSAVQMSDPVPRGRVPWYERSSVPAGWTRLALSSPSAPLRFTLILRGSNADVLEERFWRVSDPDDALFGRFMKPKEIEQLVAPTPSDLRALLSALAEHGIGEQQLVSHGDSFTVHTTVASASSLFATAFFEFEHSASGLRVSRQFGASSIPSALSSQLVLVLGVHTFPPVEERRAQRAAHQRLHAAPRAPSQTPRTIWTPAAVTALYGVPYPTAPLSTPQVEAAVIEWERESFSPSDLRNFSLSTATPLPSVDAHHIVGNNTIARPGGEASLDIQWMEAMAPSATPWFWLVDGQDSWMCDRHTHSAAAASIIHAPRSAHPPYAVPSAQGTPSDGARERLFHSLLAAVADPHCGCAVLCCVVLCCAVLCCAVLCCAVLGALLCAPQYDFSVEFLSAPEYPSIISLSYGVAEMISCTAFGNRSDCRGVPYTTYIHLCDKQVLPHRPRPSPPLPFPPSSPRIPSPPLPSPPLASPSIVAAH